MAPTRPFPINASMTAVAIGYSNPANSLIADDVMPRIPVASERFKWTYYPIEQAFTVPGTRVGRTGLVTRVSFSGTEMTDSIDDFGLEDAIPASDQEEAERMREMGLGSFDPMLVGTAGLTNLIMLDREVRVASIVQNPSNYAPNCRLVLAGSSQLSDYANSDPIGVIKGAFGGTLVFRPNTISMGRDAWTVLSSHPKLVNAVRGNVTGQGIITPAEFVNLFSGEGLKKLCIGEGYVNTARKGQVPALSRVWGKSIQFSYLDTSMRPEQGGATWGFTASYGNRLAGSWEDRNIGLQGGTVIRVGERVKEVVSAPNTGFIIQNVVA